ncbi:TonB-dependent receptor [Flavobacterium urocaniciphilum]|uniref:Outer membrane receptor for ferrienterochelin and colicins n=1 Tax=Flavobacterium urocaniciphilum TaxID=1299341 RepID=A0A1H9E3C9_9FLAO|nr:TonB-dependent receptor [Flavobacterium urocaniciphilum]SEQ19743.1 outer membrane receptor for ferrienterochelin and colicins [Flavobacterium urocaniciphilum]
MKNLIYIAIILISAIGNAQSKIIGTIKPYNKQSATITLKELNKKTIPDSLGIFVFDSIPNGKHMIEIQMENFFQRKNITVNNETKEVVFEIKSEKEIEEVVVTGTLKPVSRLETPVPVEIYTSTFLKKNPTSNIFEALQNVNGVRPQLNCNICNTGDIHINGLEGPYTMVTIDGMPIVSSLSTVYGLSGIPNSLIDRIEVVKGPASSLYGSEAVGGLINIITKNANMAPVFSADFFSTSWLENNLDLGFKSTIKNKANSLVGLNYYNYNSPMDNNHDNFTDVTLQERISIFNKWNFIRKDNKVFTLAGRFFYEDRWGGEMNWNKSYRGGNEVYGESIYTSRQELIGKYQLPVSEKIYFSFSATNHDQDSFYGTTKYAAQQRIGFGQLTWDKTINNHDLLLGSAYRYQFYNDNTTATVIPEKTNIYSFFAQDEIKFAKMHSVLLGSRLDYNNNHGYIFTPRMAYKWKFTDTDIFRINAGTGFRVVNLFTEEHAALTGSRDVIVTENLKAEKSYNVNVNYLKKLRFDNASFLGFDVSAWYTHFSNQIIPDYDTNPNQIIYKNLNGFSETKGVSLNIDYLSNFGLKAILGATVLDSKKTRDGITSTPILTEKYSANWAITYELLDWNLSFDYTGNVYGPMRLPILGELDPRKPTSPIWSIQNIQATFKWNNKYELYGGVKNLLNWTPNRKNPFLIARANDPFDENVQFDGNGNVVPTPENPYALTFDPAYVYAPNQGIRGFIGIRYRI